MEGVKQKEPMKQLRFKNYAPYDQSLLSEKSEFNHNLNLNDRCLDKLIEELKTNQLPEVYPTKINWDLKVQISQSIAILQKKN